MSSVHGPLGHEQESIPKQTYLAKRKRANHSIPAEVLFSASVLSTIEMELQYRPWFFARMASAFFPREQLCHALIFFSD